MLVYRALKKIWIEHGLCSHFQFLFEFIKFLVFYNGLDDATQRKKVFLTCYRHEINTEKQKRRHANIILSFFCIFC